MSGTKAAESAFSTVLRVLATTGEFQTGPTGAHRRLADNLREERKHDAAERDQLRSTALRAQNENERLAWQRDQLLSAARLAQRALGSAIGEIGPKPAAVADWGLINRAAVALASVIAEAEADKPRPSYVPNGKAP